MMLPLSFSICDGHQHDIAQHEGRRRGRWVVIDDSGHATRHGSRRRAVSLSRALRSTGIGAVVRRFRRADFEATRGGLRATRGALWPAAPNPLHMPAFTAQEPTSRRRREARIHADIVLASCLEALGRP